MPIHLSRRLVLATSMALCLTPSLGWADAPWPQGPIKLIVGFAAGGPTDHAARSVAKELAKELGTAVVVENKPGANGTTSIAEMKRQKADGQTLLFATSGPLAVAPARLKSLPYDIKTDFEYIGTVSGYPSLLVTKVDKPINNVAELVALSKKTSSGLSAATVSNTQELMMALFKQRFGVNVVNIPYKGDSQSITDVVSGMVDFALVSPNVGFPMIEAGRIKALGVTGPLPPPFDAKYQRIDGLDVMAWNGILVAKGTPQPIRQKLQQALARAKESKELIEILNVTGQTMLKYQGEAFRKYTLDEVQLWEQVMATAGLAKL